MANSGEQYGAVSVEWEAHCFFPGRLVCGKGHCLRNSADRVWTERLRGGFQHTCKACQRWLPISCFRLIELTSNPRSYTPPMNANQMTPTYAIAQLKPG